MIFIGNNELMKKRKLLEYFEGNPDTVYDTDKHITWHWNDEGVTTCFGFFPVSIDNRYEFLTGKILIIILLTKLLKNYLVKRLETL